VPHKLTCCLSTSARWNALHTSGRQMPVLQMQHWQAVTSSASGSGNTQHRVSCHQQVQAGLLAR
jgi:hypothetical protein